MNDSSLSSSALQLVEIIESSPTLKPIMAERPDFLGLFLRAANVAAKISSGGGRLATAVTEAIDASDLLVETIRDRKDAELVACMMAFAKAVQNLGEVLEEYYPAAIAISSYVSAAPS